MNDNKEKTIESISQLPEVLPILPLEHFVLYPYMIAPIIVGDEKSKRLIDEALGDKRLVGVVTKKPEAETITSFTSLYPVGTAANILKMLKMPDGTMRLLLHGTQRMRVVEQMTEEPYLRAKVEPLNETAGNDTETQALVQNIHTLLQRAIELSSLPEDLGVAAMNLTDPGKLADLIASNLSLKVPEQQEILEIGNVKDRLRHILVILNRELEVLELGSKIQSRVKNEMDKNQREYLLREQLKAIRKELGEEEGNSRELEELAERIVTKPLPEHTRQVADRELQRLRTMQPASAEYTVSRTYLDWILDLPWLESTTDSIDVAHARKILDEDHYDLEKIKERILEYLSVRKLKNDMKGPILCFAGPPGTGKTSLGRSIARAMGRKFFRLSLGGIRDEAEIRGHRRTYIGAMPGNIIKALKQAQANNPVVMLDEVDKLGSDYRGDPSSALLEVLDPEQNFSFTDHYLDMPFDLRNIMFITTANMLDTVPGPLRDRMEIIQLSGYTMREKVMIAKKYLIPKQLTENAITSKMLKFNDASIVRIIEDYTREAGLRNLEREIGSICRKVARRLAEGDTTPVRVTPETIPEFLGAARFYNETAQRMGEPGVAVGLAWTPVGGEILFIEASMSQGSGKFTLTGQLGDVMKESAQAALTWLHTHSQEMGIDEELFSRRDIHVHIPAGATPKDGPSAGVALTVALASLLSGKLAKNMLSMTGEITLKGNVLPVGGVKEKVLAAARAGITELILPERNRSDLENIPKEIQKKLKFHFVENVRQALELALENRPKTHRTPRPTRTEVSKPEATKEARKGTTKKEARGRKKPVKATKGVRGMAVRARSRK